MNKYTHTQLGYVIIVVTDVALIFLGLVYFMTPSLHGDVLYIAIGCFLLLVLLSFSTLQTAVDNARVQIKFGPGIFRKSFRLDEIASVATVKNRWYYGWGIRVWFWPKMWIYNVSGFQAVELRMKNGKVYRIGTDVPHELEEAIVSRLNN